MRGCGQYLVLHPTMYIISIDDTIYWLLKVFPITTPGLIIILFNSCFVACLLYLVIIIYICCLYSWSFFKCVLFFKHYKMALGLGFIQKYALGLEEYMYQFYNIVSFLSLKYFKLTRRTRFSLVKCENKTTKVLH